MNQFLNKVAVITGAASGIGRAIAGRCAMEGMKIVLADIEKEALLRTEKELKANATEILAVVTDVAKENSILSLADQTLNHFGGVHLLFNNAGVGAGSLLWKGTVADWQWVIGVNLWGVIHATRIFIPIMLNQQTECHIVNTASRAGLETGPGNGIYTVTKHAIVSFSEVLHHELTMTNAPIRVSVLCPGFVRTRICDAERNRPIELQNPMGSEEPTQQGNVIAQMIRNAVQNGMTPEKIADLTFEAIQNNKFYILPDPETKPAVKNRMKGILNETNPTFLIPNLKS